MPPTSADTATAPRILQNEQVQRRAVLNPSVNFTRKRTVPQWHAASISPVSFACIVKLPNSAKVPLRRILTFKKRVRGFTMPQDTDHIRHSPLILDVRYGPTADIGS